ncbi:hypothetical protein [Frankia canadensis]|nr:hypothetical protein [Frankia canadensis]
MLHRMGDGISPVPRGRAGLPLAHRLTRWTLAAALALPAALTAGCGGGPAAPAGARPTAVVDASRLRLPLDRYLLSPDESALVARGYRVLLAECMDRFGLSGPPEPPRSEGPHTWGERRYGITDLALAAQAGYRVSTHPPVPVARPSANDDPRTLTALTGRGAPTVNGRPVPPGGCSDETDRRLRADAPTGADEYLAQRLDQDSYFRSERDPRVQKAAQAWSACMRGHGLRYPTPLSAPADPRFRNWPVSRLEITTATTDIACKRQTNLVGIWSGVEADLQRAGIAAHRDALEKVRLTNEAQLRVVSDLHLR